MCLSLFVNTMRCAHSSQDFDCKLTRDIVDLVVRENDMLVRGRPESSLEGTSMCVCVCVCVCMRENVCVCACVLLSFHI